jgi:hypothetical protein
MHTFHNDDTISEQQQQQLLDDLELRCQTNVAAVRDACNTRTRVRIVVRAGNICDRSEVLTELVTSEVSTVAMTGIGQQPLMVGSLFYLQFDRASLDVSPALAICDRCTLLGDNSFELRFRFTQAVELGSH